MEYGDIVWYQQKSPDLPENSMGLRIDCGPENAMRC